MNKNCSIAIDGPSGAGKSTIAKTIARELGFIYVDTGAMYRAVGYFAYENGIKRENIESVIPRLGEVNIELQYADDGTQQVILNGKNVSREIRLPEMSLYASDVSKIPEVRAFLLDSQRNLARSSSVIMDGRDIGTVVLPDADIKIFLTASAEDRARRRYEELIEKGTPSPYETVLEDMKYRDRQDAERDAAPLKPADDAVTVDTTGFELEKSIAVLTDIIRKKMA